MMATETLVEALEESGFGGNMDVHLKNASEVCEIVAHYLRVVEPGATDSIAALENAALALLGETIDEETRLGELDEGAR